MTDSPFCTHNNEYFFVTPQFYARGPVTKPRTPLDPDGQVLLDCQRAIVAAKQRLDAVDCAENRWLEPHNSNYNRAVNRYARWVRERPIQVGDEVTASDWERRELPKPLDPFAFSSIDWFRRGKVVSYDAFTGRVVTSWPMRHDLREVENARRRAAGEARLLPWDGNRIVEVNDTELKRSKKDEWICHAYIRE